MSTQDLIKELELMNQSLSGESVKEDPVKESPSDNSPEEKTEEKVEDKEDSKPNESSESKPDSSESKPESKPEDLTKIIEDLRNEIALLKSQGQKSENKPEEKAETSSGEPKIDDQDFVGDLDLDEATRDPKELNKLLNQVYKKGMIDTRNTIVGELPSLISSHVRMLNEMQRTGEEFYKANEDLRAFPKVVQTVYGEISAKDSNRPLGDILKDVAIESRKRLGLTEPKPKSEKVDPNPTGDKGGSKEDGTKPSTPTLPSKGGSVGRPSGEPELDNVRAQIEAMNKSLER